MSGLNYGHEGPMQLSKMPNIWADQTVGTKEDGIERKRMFKWGDLGEEREWTSQESTRVGGEREGATNNRKIYVSDLSFILSFYSHIRIFTSIFLV